MLTGWRPSHSGIAGFEKAVRDGWRRRRSEGQVRVEQRSLARLFGSSVRVRLEVT